MFKQRLSNTLYSILTRYMASMGLMLFAVDLDDAEVKAAIKKAAKEIADEETAALIAKRDELLNEVKQLRKGKQVSPEDLEKLEQANEELKGQLTQAQKDLKAAQTNLDKATKDLQAEQGFTTKLLSDNGLSEALMEAGVKNPAHLKAVKALLSSQVQIVTEGDARIAKVGDKPLKDFVTEWAKSDDGKHFVSAPDNSGGGGGGGSNGGSGGEVKGKIDGTDAERAAHFASKYPALKT